MSIQRRHRLITINQRRPIALYSILVPIALLVFIQYSNLFELTSTDGQGPIGDVNGSFPERQLNPKTSQNGAVDLNYSLKNPSINDGGSSGNINANDPIKSQETEIRNDALENSTSNSLDQRIESCAAIKSHERGKWIHTSNASNILNSTSIQTQYYPEEIDWIHGVNLLPNFGKSQCRGGEKMYVTGLGNQCGCDAAGFRPTHSWWVYGKDKDELGNSTNFTVTPQPFADSTSQHSVVRLAHRLIKTNSTLCFAGDSIDLQLWESIQKQLSRLNRLQQLHFNSSLDVSYETREIPVNYSRPCGPLYAGFRPCGSKHMKSLKEIVIKNDDEANNTGLIRYIKFYGWSPWNVQFMEDCNIVIMNLGLHYDSRGQMYHLSYEPLIADMYASLTYLTNFTSSKHDRIGIWRSALPQHFDTSDGNYDGGELAKSKLKACLPLKDSKTKQVYNKVYEEAFSVMCNQGLIHETDRFRLACGGMWHSCTANVTSQNYHTVYKYWRRNNLTDEIEAFKERKDNVTVAGEILRWNIYDLFDVATWHTNNDDCTHFCFVPQLFEAAFHRLDLLLSAFAPLE